MGLNAPEWHFVLGGCVAAVFTGSLQPCFAILFSEIMGVSFKSNEYWKKSELLNCFLVSHIFDLRNKITVIRTC